MSMKTKPIATACGMAIRLSTTRFFMARSAGAAIALAGFLLIGHPGAASAGTITFDYVVSFGAVTPDGPAPYVTSTFDDEGSPGTVLLTMTVAATLGGADVSGMYFNFDPSLDPTSLVFSRISGTGPAAVHTTILTGADAFQADGDGEYDILFDLPPPPGNNSKRFNAGEDLVYEISGIGTLTASSFNFFAAPAGGFGPFLAVARIQSTGLDQQGSDWVAAVPEPSTLTLALLGFGAFAWCLTRGKRIPVC